MRILELCLSPGLGGLELYAFRSALALSGQHDVISVITPGGKLEERFKKHPQLQVHHISFTRSYLPLIIARRLARIIDANHIDLVHMHWGNDLAVAALAKTFSKRKPILVYTRQMQITRNKDDIYHNYLYQQMDLMLTITHKLEQEARQFIHGFADRITTLYYGVSAPSELLTKADIQQQRRQHHFGDNDFVVGLFGRLEDGKGQHLLIKAIAETRYRNVRLHALIVGHEMTPGYAETLKKMAQDLGILEQITFSDFVSEPQKLMQICDCVALTSYEETFGLVLPEAMRAGICVVGSRAGGVPEIIDHEKTGLLFEPRSADSLGLQLCRLQSDPQFRQQLAEAGKRKADETFNQETHFSQLEQHFLTLMQNQNKRITT